MFICLKKLYNRLFYEGYLNREVLEKEFSKDAIKDMRKYLNNDRRYIEMISMTIILILILFIEYHFLKNTYYTKKIVFVSYALIPIILIRPLVRSFSLIRNPILIRNKMKKDGFRLNLKIFTYIFRSALINKNINLFIVLEFVIFIWIVARADYIVIILYLLFSIIFLISLYAHNKIMCPIQKKAIQKQVELYKKIQRRTKTHTKKIV
jgi:hypothetical protein